jgi:hypothetical protein
VNPLSNNSLLTNSRNNVIERKEKAVTPATNISEFKNEELSVFRNELELDLIGSFDTIRDELDRKDTKNPNSQDIKSYSRLITRKNIGNKYEDKVNSLVERRNKIISQKYSEGLNKADERELKYIDWELDTIEDAFEGDTLDKMEFWVQKQEEIGEKIEELYTFLEKNVSRRR